MKKIGIDGRLFSQTGVGTYIQNLFLNLDNEKDKDITYYVYLSDKDFEKIHFKNKNIIKRVSNHRWHTIAEQTGFLILLLKDGLDLMHFTYFSYPIFYWRKFIATIHDTTPLIFRTGRASTKNQFVYRFKHLMFRLGLKLQVKRAIKIITPTKSVKKDLVSIYGERYSNKIVPIYEGVNNTITVIKDNILLKRKYHNFFIYVGNFYPHKNVSSIIYAFKNIDLKYRLILIGPDGYFTDKIKQLISDLQMKNRILIVRNPSQSDLVFFYKNAEAIIHPSFSEGFGLPLVEAAYFGTPIIASDIPVFKELWGGGYIAFDPKNVNDIQQKIIDFIIKKPKFEYKETLKKYSFKMMTREIVKIYKDILSDK